MTAGRNAEYLHFGVEYTTSVAKAALALGFVPNLLKPYFIYFMF